METFRVHWVLDRPSLKLVVVESFFSRSRSSSGCGYCVASLVPVALVIRDSDGLRAVDVEGDFVDLDELTRKVPELSSARMSVVAPSVDR